MFAREIAPYFKLFCAFAFMLGCCIGSFMNVVVWRLPRGESLSHPPSHCPKCGHAIAPWENIPIISWLCLHARCSNCHLPISIKYPLGEAATGILFSVVWWSIFRRNLPLETIPGFFFLTAALLAVALIDAEHWFIPNEITYSGIIFALLFSIFLPLGRFPLIAQKCGYHKGTLILDWICNSLSKLGLDLTQTPIIHASADCLAGIAVGFSIIFLIAWSLKRIIGLKAQHFAKPVAVKLNANGMSIGGKKTDEWDRILEEESDRIILHGTLVDSSDGTSSNVSKVYANSQGVGIDGNFRKWTEVDGISINATRISTPRDVIGWGDIKLLAMTGAFLGADATLYTLLLGALLGFLFACGLFLCRRRWQSTIPFGPFLALSALLQMLFM